jgi:hypothetical protein
MLCALWALPLALPAQAWKRLDIERFSFIFEERDSSYVARLVEAAPDIHAIVSGFFGYAPEGRVEVVVNGRQEDPAYGGYCGIMPLRISLSVAAGGDPALLLLHEYAHYVHALTPGGFLDPFAAIFGRDLLFGNATMSSLSIEGTTSFLDGMRASVWDEARIKAFVLEGRMWPLGLFASGGDFEPGPLRTYYTGMLFVDWLFRQGGVEAYRALHRQRIASLSGDSGALLATRGVDADEAWSLILQELERKFAPSRGISGGLALTPRVRAVEEEWRILAPFPGGALVRAGSLLEASALYAWIDDGRREARAPDPATPKRSARDYYADRPGRLAPIKGLPGAALAASLSSDGSLGAFLYAEPLATASEFEERGRSLVVARIEASGDGFEAREVRTIARGSSLHSPAMSPDGARLYALERVSGRKRLVEVDMASGAAIPLWDPGELAPRLSIASIALSPDGRRMALVLELDGITDVGLLALDGSLELEVVTRDEAMDSMPCFDPSGSLVWASDREGSIYSYRYSGGLDAAGRAAVARLFKDPVGAWKPLWLANGAIVYESYSSEGFLLKLIASAEPEALPGFHDLSPAYLERQRGIWAECAAAYPGGARALTILAKSIPPGIIIGAAKAPAVSAPPSPTSQAVIEASSPLVDLPKPGYWMPELSIVDSVALGARLEMASLVGRQSLVLRSLYYPLEANASLEASYVLPSPYADLRIAGGLGPLISMGSGYTQSAYGIAGIALRLKPGLARDGATLKASIDLEARYQSMAASTSPFSLAEGLSIARRESLAFDALAGASATWPSPTISFKGGDRLYAQTLMRLEPLLSVEGMPGISGAFVAGAAFLDGLFGAGIEAAASNLGYAGRFLSGKGPWYADEAPLRLKLSLEAGLPMHSRDGALLGAVPSERAWLGYWISASARVARTGAFALDDFLVMGVEATAWLLLYYNHIPLYAGFELRVPFSRPPELTDLKLWLSFNGASTPILDKGGGPR